VDERLREDPESGTSIALVGPGAIGSTVAALAYEAGNSITLCGRTPRDTIELRPDDGDPVVVPGPVHIDARGLDGPVDVVLLAVKDTQTEGAAAWLARLCDANTVVCALQNGVEQVERVGRFCPDSTVVPAAVWFSAETHPDGHIRLRTAARLTLPDDPAAKRLAETLRSPRLSIECSADFATEAWRKLLTNAVAGLMVLTGRKSGMFRRDDVARLATDYLAECLAVARAEGANLDDAVIGEIIGLFVGLPEDVTTSILTDREQRRPMEWDVRNGVITRRAAEHGLATPISDVLVPLLAAADEGPG
jgi:2-dehydropantoate 2-reductase